MRGPKRQIGAILALLVFATFQGAPARAYEELVTQLPRRGNWARMFDGSELRAEIRDRFFHGHAHERRELLPNGRLRVQRVKVYTHVEHPETHRVVKLPKRWKVTSVIELTPSLRLARESIKLDFSPTIDDVLDGYRFTEEHEGYFEWDEARIVANPAGNRLTGTKLKAGRTLQQETYDYEPDDVPMEIVGYVLTAAVEHGVDRFDFDVLLPGGSTHEIETVVHRTRDLRPFGKEYRLPGRIRRKLEMPAEVALLEMRLASPIKYLLYPHKFYLAYVNAAPENLVAFWGGKPGSHLYAFRTDPWHSQLAASR